MVPYFEASTYLKPLFQHPRELFHRQGEMSYRNRGPTLSWSPATPQKLSSYHPDNPRRHGSQLSPALMMSHKCALSQCPRTQNHLHLPIQRKPLSWVGWEKNSPTMRQHSSKQIIVHQAVATYVTTDPKHSHISSLPPSLHQ